MAYSHTTIEELTNSDHSQYDQQLESLLIAHHDKPADLLETVFDFLQRKTGFFKLPSATQTVAKLAQDAKARAHAPTTLAKATAPEEKATPGNTQNPGSDDKQAPQQAASLSQKESQQQPAPVPAKPSAATPAAPPSPAPQLVPAPVASGSGTAESSRAPDEQDANEDSGKLKPNSGNGADLDKYSWTQTLAEVSVAVPVPPGTKGKQCDVAINKTRLRVGLKGQPPILEGELPKPVKQEESFWNIMDGRSIEVSLQKVDTMNWWSSVAKGEPEIDTQKVDPESSRLTDLDQETRGVVEKMMFDQRQKAMGLPTSEEAEKQAKLKQFMAAHPELDFSNAKIS